MSRPVNTGRDKIYTKVDGGGATFLAVKMEDWVRKSSQKFRKKKLKSTDLTVVGNGIELLSSPGVF